MSDDALNEAINLQLLSKDLCSNDCHTEDFQHVDIASPLLMQNGSFFINTFIPAYLQKISVMALLVH